MTQEMEQILTPIFDAEMGFRLGVARMAMKMSQAELGQFLGVSQAVMSDIEQGRTPIPGFPIARLNAVLGGHASYVLLNKNKHKYNVPRIKKSYWEKRLKLDRKNRAQPQRFCVYKSSI